MLIFGSMNKFGWVAPELMYVKLLQNCQGEVAVGLVGERHGE